MANYAESPTFFETLEDVGLPYLICSDKRMEIGSVVVIQDQPFKIMREFIGEAGVEESLRRLPPGYFVDTLDLDHGYVYEVATD